MLASLNLNQFQIGRYPFQQKKNKIIIGNIFLLFIYYSISKYHIVELTHIGV